MFVNGDTRVEPDETFFVDIVSGTNVTLPSEGLRATGVIINDDFAPPTGSISGTKFHDLDEDGERDDNEFGLQGWVIELHEDDDNNPDQTATTDAGGFYMFAGLAPGTYRVRERLQDGWRQTTPDPDETS